jgi:hypothetical protein
MKFNQRLCAVVFLIALCSCSNSGTQFALPQMSDQFSGQVFYNNKVDILFVIDNSKSMLQYQQRLASKVGDMVNTLNHLGMDYRVAVTTTTMSSNTTTYPMTRQIIGQPTYLTSQNINLLADRIIVGEAGADLERGLDSMRYVTSAAYLNSIKSDFMRMDALFSVVFISDEVDQSSEFGNPNSNDFVNYLNTLKPTFSNGARAWLANYIGILTNNSCDNLGGYVSIGTQFIKLVDASGGTKSSICNADLTSAISDIKARIVDQLTAYRFKDVPNKSTIQVTVGGIRIAEDVVNGWTLETEVNAEAKTIYLLKFHGSGIPGASEQVTVNYKPAGAT